MEKQGNERLIVTGVVGLLLVSWLGFLLHRSPRFPGSGIGTIVGIVAALLMLLPLAYTLAKRISPLREHIAPVISLKALMTVHVYAGVLGPILAIIHTGHKFDSVLGIALTSTMLFIVVSGLAVRYLLAFVTHEIKDKLILLQTARGDLDNAWGLYEVRSAAKKVGNEESLVVMTEVLPESRPAVTPAEPAIGIISIAESVADLEYSVRLHEILKVWFGRALKAHIGFSILFYVLLIAHVIAGVQYGFRWFT